jgi:hypothetical protein
VFRGALWAAFLDEPGGRADRDRYRSQRGRLRAMESIRDQVRDRGIADTDDVEIKSAFFKHRTRRFQALNVWPAEASASGDDERGMIPIPSDAGEIFLRLATLKYGIAPPGPPPTEFVIPQRVRWFKVRKFGPDPWQPNETAD